jgi:hypothetical protein
MKVIAPFSEFRKTNNFLHPTEITENSHKQRFCTCFHFPQQANACRLDRHYFSILIVSIVCIKTNAFRRNHLFLAIIMCIAQTPYFLLFFSPTNEVDQQNIALTISDVAIGLFQKVFFEWALLMLQVLKIKTYDQKLFPDSQHIGIGQIVIALSAILSY